MIDIAIQYKSYDFWMSANRVIEWLWQETHDEPVIEGTIVSVKSGSSVTGIYSLKML